MITTFRLLRLLVVSSLFTWCGWAVGASGPNFILIFLDDAVPNDLNFLPKTTGYLKTDGVLFSNMFVTNGLCGPSRASMLTGKYSHNTGVYTNDYLKNGGFQRFFENGNESQTIATFLHARGYSTSLVGKYMNGYGFSRAVPPNYIPPGWDQWYGLTSTVKYYNYILNENGSLTTYGSGSGDYATDVLAGKAIQTIDQSLVKGQPFFLLLTPFAPHVNTGSSSAESEFAIPAPRHALWFDGIAAPRPASFNEQDISDKAHSATRNLPLLSPEDIQWIDKSYRARVQSLQAVDEMIDGLISKLSNASALKNTYIILTGDHGFFFGDHRQRDGKVQMYEPANRAPLLISGPGVIGGSRRTELVSNIDLFPTIADLATMETLPNVDGRSFSMLIRSSARQVSGTRRSLLRVRGTTGAGIRLPTYSYTEVYRVDGSVASRELYDLTVDPDETRNLVTLLTPESVQNLSRYTSDVRHCVAADCRRLEDTAGDWLVRFAQSP